MSTSSPGTPDSLDEDGGPATRLPTTDVAIAVRAWRDGLINLTGTNRALNFRHTRTGTVAIEKPGVREIFEGLRSGREWVFEGKPDDDAEPAEQPRVLANPRTRLLCRRVEKDLGPILRSLARRANQEFLDRGLSVMYVALGMLHWKDLDDTAYTSPLLLVPVEFIPTGSKSKPLLKINRDEDPTLNPALTLRVSDFDVTLPVIDDLTDLSVETLLEQIRSAVTGQKGWTVTEEAVLAAFSFQKEAMYRDLLTNEATITGHPLVKALANQDPSTQDSSLLFDPISPEDIDREAPPESTPLVLDADSSQRAGIAAAVAGHSFVMDGPPGTGKSQTIANMIGSLLHAGKTVLFVSEKAAALEVVRNRLAQVGLENYLLELHSHKASRKEVAAQLASALDTVPIPPSGLGALDRRRAAEKRESLNAYAAAMNRVRSPLGESLHHVLGRIAILDHVPAAPTPTAPGSTLSQDVQAEIADAAARLQRAWRPATQGQSYLWRQVTDRTPLDTRLYVAESALEELVGTAAHNRDLAEAYRLHSLSDLQVMVDLLRLVGVRPPGVKEEWLTTEDISAVRETADELAADLAAISQTERLVTEAGGVPWTTLPEPARLPPMPSLAHLTPPAIRLADLTAADARDLTSRFEADATMLEERLTALNGLARALRLPPVTTVQDMDMLLSLADVAFVAHRPERAWLSADGLAQARAAAHTLRARVRDLDGTESSAKRLYTDAALTQPLAELHERFTSVHKGFRKLLGAYRRDKKIVAAFTTEMATLEAAISDLGLAVAWSQASTAYARDEAALSRALGGYWRGRNTDFAALDQALDVADDVVRRAPSQLLPAIADHVTAAPEPALKAVIDQTRSELAEWRSSLAAAPARAARPELLLGPLADAVAWLKAHLGPLNGVAAITQAVSAATGRITSLDEASALLAARQSVVGAHASLAARSSTFTVVLGEELYRATDTDLTALAEALDWAERVRCARTRLDHSLTTEEVKSLSSARPTEHLESALQRWQSAAAAITNAFDAARHHELSTEFDTASGAEGFLADLKADTTGQEEWIAYARARSDLVGHGLADVVRFCVDQHVPAEQVGQVVQRSVLRSWVDAVMAADGELQPLRAMDRTALIDEYRDLDRQLIRGAVGDIIRSVNARRPASTDVGEPAVIRREGVKKTRHISVRELIRRTRTTTLALKPCFMMSPLAVSQYLPADLRFDVVIFDEASQVTPGDAINCVYRGSALITAGDDKQLPPTSFFDRMTDDEEETETDVKDFQSILELSKASGAFRNLGLRWHYRSRHEALIAFSNQKFYEGKLVTFPGSHSEGSDVGVELIHVPGIYRRGTSRDNPVEAQHVAQRVVHHFESRPDTSLGVVTFSVAQADAIQTALDRELETRPDLSMHLDSDRLHGFFIKSLESVQGDERDVMIFSIGYGPDEFGKVTSNFGALNKARGWRRLNVAITRARQRVEIITSIRAGDVPDSSNESVRHLTGYLDYAERGVSALALDLGASGLDTDSPFEDSVIDVIRAMGLIAEPQVGAAGYRIDIGVRHPAHAGVYTLGVECDGYMYHSSPAARDRDRLRQQVLEGLGWNLHRIWGTAWYRDRASETERLRSAIERAINAPITGRLSGTVDQFERAEIELAEIDRYAPPPWVRPYVPASVPSLARWVDPSDRSARWDMVEGIEVLARDEGPVHIELVYQRLRSAWGIGRVGHIVRDNILGAIRQADVVFTDDFLDIPVRMDTAVRVPADGEGQRTVAQVPEVELQNALTNLLRDAGIVSRGELITAVARVFGWNRRGQDITNRLSWVLSRMAQNGVVAVDGDLVRLAERA